LFYFFSFVCPTEIIAFSESIQRFEEINAVVLAISVDSVFTHLAWTKLSRDKGGLGPVNVPLLSDQTKTISKVFYFF
jgi:alkyl hydroperoxide reductase subunit AhpC